MGGEHPDDGSWPDEIFQQMKAGHEKFMRDLRDQDERSRRDFEHPRQNDTYPVNKNPFLAFKDFVDTNLSTLAENFKSLPVNIAELKAKMQEERQRAKEEKLARWQRWTGIVDSPDHTSTYIERLSKEQRDEATAATVMLLREAHDRNANVSPEKIEALYKDNSSPGGLDAFATPMLSPGGACYYLPESGNNGYNQPSTNIWRWPAATPRWLSVDWFKQSPYSPINLEAHPHLSQDGTKWRAAFEDLINAALDKPMTSREQVGQRIPQGRPQSTLRGPGLDWMLSLQCRGILPPQLPSLYSSRLDRRGQKLSLESYLGPKSKGERSPAFGRWDREFDELADEISTPAPQTSVEPSWHQPETEQDLYDTLYAQQPPLTASQRDEARLGSWHEDEEALRLELEGALLEALQHGDIDIDGAVQCLTAWHKTHGDIDDLAHGALSVLPGQNDRGKATSWHSTLEEAPKVNETPDPEVCEAEVVRANKGASERANETKCEGPSEVQRRIRDLKQRGDQLAGQTFTWPSLTLEELEDQVARLEQEHEALGLDEGHGPFETERKTQAGTDVQERRKVDVLSSLTTTQTTRLPDGTITTKVVLKQRFADGREETEEKVHTYREPQQDTAKAETESPKKSGWFWT